MNSFYDHHRDSIRFPYRCLDRVAGLLSPVPADSRLHHQKQSQLDRLYQRGVDDLDALVRAVGIKAA
jgi:hypothetical protein